MRDVSWPNGTKYRVRHWVCQSCGAREIIRRDWSKQHEKDEPQTGQAMAADGRVLAVEPIDE